MTMLRIATSIVIALAGCSPAARGPTSASAGEQNPSAQQIPEPGPAELTSCDRDMKRFDLHGHFWLSLHHFAYAMARREAQSGSTGPRIRAVRMSADDWAMRERLSESEREAWQAAVSYYRDNIIDRNLLFDPAMVEIKNALLVVKPSSPTATATISPDLARALDRAAPVYRARWWPTHRRVSCAWIEAIVPQVEAHGETLATGLAAAYATTWPERAIPVSVLPYAIGVGAYTTIEPTHVTIGAIADATASDLALEVLFHEASHGLIRPIFQAILTRAGNRGSVAPRDLWHALLFYTTGELVKRVKGPDYVPYAYRRGLYQRGSWRGYGPILQRHWQPHLDGKATLEAALDNLLAELTSTPKKTP